jgi:asparagine N-glycosylation enzyme membrane subunit Stt3
VAFVGVAPLALAGDWPQWSDYSPAVLSRFQPWMLGALALHAAACAALWRFTAFGRSRLARAAQVGGIGVAILGLSLWAFPDLIAGAADAWRWLARDEEFQELVKESRPLFYGREGFDLAIAELRLSRFVWLLPFSLAALAWRAKASGLRAPLLLLLLWVCVLAGGTLLQRRFFNSLSPAFALVIAWSCIEAARRLPAPLVATSLRRRLVAAAAALGVLWMMAPSLAAYRVPLSNAIRIARGEARLLRPVEQKRRNLLDAAEWLRHNTPPTSGYLDPDAAPEYGVLAPWGYGHLLKYAARRPTVVGNFGDDVGEENLRKVDVYFLNREQEATWSLDRLKARYVLLRTLDEADPEKLNGQSMRKRLSVDDSPGLAHHRLVYESPLDPTRSASGRSEFRIFEYVAGADVFGTAPAGAQVRASLRYESNRGRRGSYRTRTRADAAGRYRLRLPYATRAAPPATVTDPAYRIRAGAETALLEIDEAQVRKGLAVEGPSFAKK